jgi:anti-sigma B factor antagonist
MPLVFESRIVGEIVVVTCRGSLVDGDESAALHRHLTELLPRAPFIVADLGGVGFIDSSGLGMLVRLLANARQARGGLKLCAVPPKVSEVLRVTRLATIFESYGTEADAIAAYYERPPSKGSSDTLDVDVVCIEQSANVLAYVRELLKRSGLGVATATNVPDALTLIRAMHPKVVVIGADTRSVTSAHAAEALRDLTNAVAVIELPPAFSGDDAGMAGRELLDRVRAAMRAPA